MNKYIITEGADDVYYIGNIFRNLKDDGWMLSPIGGGKSEAIALAESLAIRHTNGKIVLAIDLDEIELRKNQMSPVEMRLCKYNNIEIIFAVPDIESEILRMIKPDEGILRKLIYSLTQKREIVKQEFDKFVRGNRKFNQTEYFKKIQKAIGRAKPKLAA